MNMYDAPHSAAVIESMSQARGDTDGVSQVPAAPMMTMSCRTDQRCL
jgi:hypothetical protein